MPDLFKWLSVLGVALLGIVLVLEPTLITLFPAIIHYIAGIALIGAAGYGAYKLS